MRYVFLLALLLGVPALAHAQPLKIALVSGSLEYESDASLTILGELLEKHYQVKVVPMFRKTDTDIPGLEKLSECDLAIFYTRRLKPVEPQLTAVKAYLSSSKPVVGLRSASHGFQEFLEMDKEVFGGSYANHYKAGPICNVTLNANAAEHPILKGITPFTSPGSLYKNANVAKDATILLTGEAAGNKEPVAWARTRTIENGAKQRIFYTSIGHPKDFQDKNYLKLLTNAVEWTLGDKLKAK